MNEKRLAQELRERQVAKFSEIKMALPPEMQQNFTKEEILSVPDQKMISSYIICSHCGEWLITYAEALDIMKRCNTSEEFLQKTEEIMAGH